MMSSEKKLKSLSDIFDGKKQFFVPDYQRGYSWEQKQLEDLWEDLDNMTETNCHYTGMFTFCKQNGTDNYFDIVDGQQRMTTLIILINELLKKIDGPVDEYTTREECIKKYLFERPVSGISSNLKYKFQYSSDNPSDSFFKTKILEQEYTGALLYSQNTLYTRNLRAAKDFFKERITDFSQDKLKSLFKKVTERLTFNEYYIDDINEVYVTFETMNNRGKNLSTLELLKNRLLYLTTLFPLVDSDTSDNTKALWKNIIDTWTTIYDFLGKSSNKKLSDDGFLKDHWIMYFRYDRKTSNVFKEDLLSKEFTAKRVLNKELHIGDIDKYVTCLRKSVKYWFYINCPDECEIEGESKMWLTRLSHVGSGSFRPLLMATFFHKKPEDDFSAFLKACERFRFLVFGVSGRRANTEDYHFYGMAHDFFTGKLKTSIQDLTNDINKRTLDWLNIDNFIKETVDRYQKRHGFYSWAGIRYFLYEYERELQENAAGREIKVNWDIFENNEKDKVSIEHIFPQTPDNPYWTQRFDDKDKSLTHSLGNLLLLSVAKNSKLQNGSFIEKKQKYKTGSHSEIKIAEKEEWTPNDIIERGKELLDFLKRHWEIDCDFSEEEISELLNIKPAVIENVTELDNNEDYDNDDMLVDESYE